MFVYLFISFIIQGKLIEVDKIQNPNSHYPVHAIVQIADLAIAFGDSVGHLGLSIQTHGVTDVAVSLPSVSSFPSPSPLSPIPSILFHL